MKDQGMEDRIIKAYLQPKKVGYITSFIKLILIFLISFYARRYYEINYEKMSSALSAWLATV